MKKDENNNNAYIERIKVLEKDIEAYRKDGENLGNQILDLRRSVSSYKGANTKYRQTIEALTSRRDSAVAEAEKLKAELAEISEKRDELRCQVETLKNQILEYKDKINALKVENNDLNDALEYEQSPWWKKLFL